MTDSGTVPSISRNQPCSSISLSVAARALPPERTSARPNLPPRNRLGGSAHATVQRAQNANTRPLVTPVRNTIGVSGMQSHVTSLAE
jgi:hypothetical protein